MTGLRRRSQAQLSFLKLQAKRSSLFPPPFGAVFAASPVPMDTGFWIAPVSGKDGGDPILIVRQAR
jgi:hypothetical protein